MRTRRRHPASCGFTLIEMIATIAVIAVIGTVSSSLIYTATDGYTTASTQAQLHAEASIAMDRLMRELRSIAVDTSGSDNVPDINSISPTAITWETDYAVTLTGQTLSLQIDGGTARTLLNNVSALTIQAYDESNTALAATLSGAGCDPVRRLEITLTLTRYGTSYTLRSRVFLRGMMLGA